MVAIKVGTNLDKALKQLKILVDREKILSTYIQKLHYLKPSEKKRLKKLKAERRRKKISKKPQQKSKKLKVVLSPTKFFKKEKQCN